MESKFLKRICSLAIVVFMVLSMVPTNVFAAEATEETLPDGYCPECKVVHEWVTFDAATHLDANRYITPGYYKLGANVTLKASNSYQADGTTKDPSVSTADIKIAADTKVCLDLAGYDIAVTNYAADTASAVGRYSRAITNAGTLSIMDSSAEQTGEIKNGRIGSRVPSSYGNGGNILNTGTLNLYSGTITGGTAYGRVYNAGALGGNIANEKGSVFNMYGGTVSNGTVNSGSFNYDTDSKKAHQGGGNIYSAGEVNIFDGTIEGGSLTGAYSRESSGAYGFYSKGGSIFMHTGTFNMTGGTITGGRITRSFTFKNSTNNAKASAYCYGGNLYAINTDVSISNATITNGSITSTAKGESDSTSSYAAAAYCYGGNIYINGDDNHTKVTITNSTISGGVVNGDAAYADTTVTDNHGKGLYVNNIGGNIYLTEVARTTIDGNTVISGGSCGGSTATDDKTHQGFGGNIHSNRLIYIKGNTQILNGVANDNPGGNIYLGNYSTCTISENAKVTGGIGNGNSGGGNIYITGAKSTLNIQGNAEVSGGSARGGGNIYANADSKVNITGGTIKDGISTWDQNELYWAGGNLLTFNGASATITGGTISGGTANRFFHSIGTRGEGTLNILGGQILGTDAEKDLPLIGELNPTSGYGVFVYNGTVAEDPTDFLAPCACYELGDNGEYKVWHVGTDANLTACTASNCAYKANTKTVDPDNTPDAADKHEYNADGYCTICGIQALARVDYVDGTVEHYASIIPALQAANGTGATVTALRNTSTKWYTYFQTYSTRLHNVTLATENGARMYDTSVNSGEKVYMEDVTFAPGIDYRMTGYLHTYGTTNIYGTVFINMMNIAGDMNIYGDQGATLTTNRNTWIENKRTVSIYGKGDGELVWNANILDSGSYSLTIEGSGKLYLENAKVSFAGVDLDTAGSGTLEMVNSSIEIRNEGSSFSDIYSMTILGKSKLIMKGNSSLDMIGTMSIGEDAQIILSGNSTVTTLSGALQNNKILAAEDFDGCIYVAEETKSAVKNEYRLIEGSTDDYKVTPVEGEYLFYTYSAAGHTYGEYTSNNDATCEADGTKSATCSNCQAKDTVTDADSKLDHNYGDWQQHNAAQHKKVCANDATHVITEAHTMGEWVNGTRSCTANCGYTETCEHNYKYTPNGDGTHNGVCANNCGIADNGTCDTNGAGGACSKCGYIAKTYVAEVNGNKYESLQAAVDAATAGDTVKLLTAISDEAVTVEKTLTITSDSKVKLTNVSINGTAGKLTVENLEFAGNSWINAGGCDELVVKNVSANVTPSNTAYTNSRSAFISLGRSEQKQLKLTVTGSDIVANGGADPILGWAAITEATLTGNTFGSADAYQNNSDSVKFMAIADGAVITVTDNTVYSNYNGFVFAQNTTRDNAYTVILNNNKFYGGADHIWVEISGGNTVHATIEATSDNTVNGNAFTAKDIKYHSSVITTWDGYAGVDVTKDAEGKITGGSFLMAPAEDQLASGLEAADTNGDGIYEITEKNYVAEVNGTKYESLADAFAAAEDGDTITVLADITYTKDNGYVNGTWVDGLVYTGDKSFTVDFGGHTITDNGDINDYLIYLKNQGEKDNEITFQNGKIIVKSERTNTVWAAVTVGAASATHKTTLNLTGMEIVNNNPNNEGNLVIRVRNGSVVNLNNGTVVTSDGTSYGAGAETGSTLNVNSGAKVVQINSGTTSGNVVYTAISGNGTINIYDGAVIESDKYGIHNMTTGNAVINIYGGTITAPVTVHASTNGGTGETATVTITGGTFNGTLETTNNDSKIVVSGGSFDAPVDEKFCAEGYQPKDNGDGTYGVVLHTHVYTAEYHEATFEADAYTVYTCACGDSYTETHAGTKKTAVAEVDGTKYESLADALEAADDGDTVILLADVTLDTEVTLTDMSLTITGDYTLDANDKLTLAGTVSLNAPKLTGDVKAAANAVIKDTNIGGYLYLNASDSNLTFQGDNKVDGFSASYYNNVITIGAGAYLEITGSNRLTIGWGNTFNITGTITDAKTADKSAIKPSLKVAAGITVNGSSAKTTLNVTNAYIVFSSTCGTNKNASGGFVISFTNSIADLSMFKQQYAIGTYDVDFVDSVINVAMNLTFQSANAVVDVDNSQITVGSSFGNAGTFTLKNGSVMNVSAMVNTTENGTNSGLTIVDNATLNATGTSIFKGYSTGVLKVVNGGTATINKITDATVSVDVDSTVISNSIDSTNTIKVDVADFAEAVTVIEADLSGYTGQIALNNNNGTIIYEANANGLTVRKAVASVNGVAYESLQEAIDAAGEGDTVKLLADITVSEVIMISNAVTLDGNDHTITSSANRVIRVAANATVNDLKMVSTAVRVGTSDIRGISVDNVSGVTLTLNNCSVDFTDESASDWSYAVNQSGETSNGNTITINGGTYEGANVVNIWGTNHTVNIDGATLTSLYALNDLFCGVCVKTNPASTADITVKNSTFNGTHAVAFDVADNTVAKENNADNTKRYVAKVGSDYFYTLAEAVAAANDGDTVKLLTSVTITELIKIEEAITLDLNGKKVTATSKKAFEVYANATIMNGTIEAEQRCVDTRKAVELTLTDVNLIADKYTSYGNPQPLTIGGSENGTKVNMTNVNISAEKGYGIITFVKTQLNATGCTISGYNALYVKPGSEESVFNFNDCDLTGSTTSNDVEGNSFSTIAVRADDVTVNVDADSTVSATGNYCWAISLDSKFTGESGITGANITVAGTINGKVLTSADVSKNTISVKAEYAAQLQNAGYGAVIANGMATAVVAVASVNGTYYATLAEAVAAANDGDTVKLLSDVTITELIKIEDAITLDLNGKTITANCRKAIEVYADATITNGTIIANERCVDTRKAVELTLTNVNLLATQYKGANQQPLTIGGSENGTVVNLNNVTIDAGTQGYAIITFVETEMNVVDSNISGYMALYVKDGSEGSEFNFENSTLTSDITGNDVAENTSNIIAVETDNVSVNLDGGALVAKGNNVVAIDLRDVTGAELVIKGDIDAPVILKTTDVENNTISVKAEYADDLVACGYVALDNGDGTVTAHIHVYESQHFAATNTENAYTVYTCSCGDTYTEVEEGTMLHYAVNETTGESYTTVQAALNAAAKGDTVKVLKDATEDSIFVGAGIKLDLNGKKLTIVKTLTAAFSTSHIIDNTNGEGLLVLTGASSALNSYNEHLPMWTTEGVRFTAASFKEQLTIKDENTAQYAFYLNMDLKNSKLGEILANGSAGTGISIRIKVTYKTANGMTAVQYFELTSEMVAKYVENSANKAIALTVTGIQGREDLTFTAEIASTNPNDSKAPVVVIDKVDP